MLKDMETVAKATGKRQQMGMGVSKKATMGATMSGSAGRLRMGRQMSVGEAKATRPTIGQRIKRMFERITQY